MKSSLYNGDFGWVTNETVGGRGIISGPMSNNLLTFYQHQKDAIEEEISNRSQLDSRTEKQFK